MLRLLPKSEVDRAKALDRQREITEGAKLASKVDSLRKLAAEEELQLSKFRESSLGRIQEAINALIESKDSLEREVATLEEVKRKALLPVKDREQKSKQLLAEASKEHERVQSVSASFEAYAKDTRKELAKKETSLQRLKDSLEAKQLQVDEATQSVHDREDLLRERTAQFNNTLQATLSDQEVRTIGLNKKEQELVIKEAEVRLRYDYALAREKANAEKEQNLISRYQNLDIAIEEMKNKYPNLKAKNL